ncbi:MAG: VWA domain-containing protein, partial [Candidatus Aminicenantes bacterium]|nr:VWA domain-containing protein [Candidatus Aminicenantes bacterium]
IVIFSDGMDTRSKNTRENVFLEAQNANIPLYFIGLGEKVNEVSLKELSEGTGGHFFRAASPEEILLLYQKIAEQLQNQYILTFPSSFGEDEEWHTLNIAFKEMSGNEFTIQRKYQATKGPGVSRAIVAGFERQSENETLLISLGIGVFAGLFFGLLIVFIIKLTRPDIPLFSLLVIGVILCAMLLGGILGAFANILSTT